MKLYYIYPAKILYRENQQGYLKNKQELEITLRNQLDSFPCGYKDYLCARAHINDVQRWGAWVVVEVEVGGADEQFGGLMKCRTNPFSESNPQYTIKPLKTYEYTKSTNQPKVEEFNRDWLTFGPYANPFSKKHKCDKFTLAAAELPLNSPLLQPIADLRDSLTGHHQYAEIGKALFNLIKGLAAKVNPEYVNPEYGMNRGNSWTDIEAFQKQVYALVQPTANEKIFKALGVILITVVATVAVAAIGFGIGFALGAWAGPMAFFTGIATATAAAMAVTATAAGAGIAAGSISSYCLFFRKSEEKAVNQLVSHLEGMIPKPTLSIDGYQGA